MLFCLLPGKYPGFGKKIQQIHGSQYSRKPSDAVPLPSWSSGFPYGIQQWFQAKGCLHITGSQKQQEQIHSLSQPVFLRNTFRTVVCQDFPQSVHGISRFQSGFICLVAGQVIHKDLQVMIFQAGIVIDKIFQFLCQLIIYMKTFSSHSLAFPKADPISFIFPLAGCRKMPPPRLSPSVWDVPLRCRPPA